MFLPFKKKTNSTVPSVLKLLVAPRTAASIARGGTETASKAFSIDGAELRGRVALGSGSFGSVYRAFWHHAPVRRGSFLENC